MLRFFRVARRFTKGKTAFPFHYTLEYYLVKYMKVSISYIMHTAVGTTSECTKYKKQDDDK